MPLDIFLTVSLLEISVGRSLAFPAPLRGKTRPQLRKNGSAESFELDSALKESRVTDSWIYTFDCQAQNSLMPCEEPLLRSALSEGCLRVMLAMLRRARSDTPYLLALGMIWILGTAESPAGAAEPVNFYDEIKPLFAVHCHKCHIGEKPKGGLLLDTLQHALAGGKSGEPSIVPGASARSELIRRTASSDPDEQMPPKGRRLTEAEIERVKRWIDAGAKWPEGDDYWAFQPPKEQDIPPVTNAQGIRNSID